MFKIILIVVILLLIVPKVLCYNYTVDVAKLKCTKGKIDDGTTDISISGSDALSLKYEWAVNFTIKNNCTSQRCTLMAWKSIQELYRALNYAEKPTEIKVDNKILLSTLQYKINVTARINNSVVEFKEFVWECGAANEEGSKDKLHALLKLLGPNVTYPDLTYTINAVVENYDSPYYFRWNILDHGEKLVKTDLTKGSMLSFRSNSLATNQEYVIKCSVMDSEQGNVIAMSTHDLVIMSRGILLNLPVKQLHVGANRVFKLNAYYEDVDNVKGYVNFQWTCHDEQNKICSNFKSPNSTYLEDCKFSAVGRYRLQIFAEKNGAKVSDSTVISVIRNGYAGIEVDDFAIPVDPSKEIVIPAYVNTLMADCSLQWSCLNSSGYGFVDLSKAPGNVADKTIVRVKSNEFLNEIDEYSNETVEKHYNLVLSKPHGSWLGLGSDMTYLFRLNVTCPIPDNSDSLVEQVLKYVTLIADISLTTSPIPVLSALFVTPREGIALTTKFLFRSNDSLDAIEKVPYMYKFGYYANNQAIFLSHVLNEKNWSNVLPFINNGVSTLLECCNSYAMCSQVKGPNVTTSLTTYSEEQKSNFQHEVKLMMEREEYYKAFAQATGVLLTYKALNDKTLTSNFENFTCGLAISEAKRLIQLSHGDNEAWRVSGGNFIRHVGLILDQISSSELLNSVVSLRNKLLENKDAGYLNELGGTFLTDHSYHRRQSRSVIRPKREISRITLEEVKTFLVISELIILNSNHQKKVQEEKENLVKQVDKFMVQLCGALYEKTQTISLDMKTVSLALEKLNRNNINREFKILRDTTTWNVNGNVKFVKCFVENLSSTNQLCIGRAIYKDYFNKSSFIYMVKVYGTKHSDETVIEDLFCEVLLVLPIDKNESEESKAQCALWVNKWDQSKCKTLQVSSKTIKCQCGRLGYYSLEYNKSSGSATVTTVAQTTRNTVSTEKTEVIGSTTIEYNGSSRGTATTSPVLTSTTSTKGTTKTTVPEMANATKISSTRETTTESAEKTVTATSTTVDSSKMSTEKVEVISSTTVGYNGSSRGTATTSPVLTSTQEMIVTKGTTQTTVPEMANATKISSTRETTTTEVTATVDSSTEVQIEEKLAEVEYETACYVIIGISVMGTFTLLYGIKRIVSTSGEVRKDDLNTPRYEKLQDEEVLDDFSITNKCVSC